LRRPSIRWPVGVEARIGYEHMLDDLEVEVLLEIDTYQM
jgi:hypothetical protein